MTSRVGLNALLFILGFSIVFVSMGASATYLGSFLRSHFSIFNKIAGILIVVLGLHFLGVYRIPWLYYEKRFHTKSKASGILTPLVVGLLFAFGWTPCVGPILAGVLLLASNQNTVVKGMILLIFYSAGLGIPFLVAGVGFNLFLNVFEKMRRYFRTIEVLSGLFLISIGVLIFLGSLGLLTDVFYKLLD